ncbi:MAG: Multidrug resistance protein 3 [Anaerolineales bacterium]|nr:Multidrug resistance protein 3 [Anaerolineales bacterium]
MPRNRIILVTIGIMLSLFLASMESTVVATATPTIVGELGGLSRFSWVFSAYMLASTTVVPLYGKLSDLYGRRNLYLLAIALFLAGSILCGTADSMTQLILARALQGVGAGGIMPLAFILIGEMFSLQERTKMQGVFSGVWGVSSIIGPLLGGFLVDALSWRWVFYINIIPGLLAAGLVAYAWRDRIVGAEKPSVDYAGAVLLTSAIVALLIGLLDDSGSPARWAMIGASLPLFGALLWVERRAADPILPLHLFKERLFASAVAHGVFSGWALFGSVSFVPLFVQTALGTSATRAGVTISPMLLGWVAASIVGARILLKVGYRRLTLVGASLLLVGAFFLSRVHSDTSQAAIMACMALMGVGMGLAIPSFLIAVQTMVHRRYLGAATSIMQFSRSLGGTLGVSVMGAALTARLSSSVAASDLDPKLISQLLEPHSSSNLVVNEGARLALTDAIAGVFIIAFITAALALAGVLFAPRLDLREESTGGEPQPLAGVD